MADIDSTLITAEQQRTNMLLEGISEKSDINEQYRVYLESLTADMKDLVEQVVSLTSGLSNSDMTQAISAISVNENGKTSGVGSVMSSIDKRYTAGPTLIHNDLIDISATLGDILSNMLGKGKGSGKGEDSKGGAEKPAAKLPGFGNPSQSIKSIAAAVADIAKVNPIKAMINLQVFKKFMQEFKYMASEFGDPSDLAKYKQLKLASDAIKNVTDAFVSMTSPKKVITMFIGFNLWKMFKMGDKIKKFFDDTAELANTYGNAQQKKNFDNLNNTAKELPKFMGSLLLAANLSALAIVPLLMSKITLSLLKPFFSTLSEIANQYGNDKNFSKGIQNLTKVMGMAIVLFTAVLAVSIIGALAAIPMVLAVVTAALLVPFTALLSVTANIAQGIGIGTMAQFAAIMALTAVSFAIMGLAIFVLAKAAGDGCKNLLFALAAAGLGIVFLTLAAALGFAASYVLPFIGVFTIASILMAVGFLAFGGVIALLAKMNEKLPDALSAMLTAVKMVPALVGFLLGLGNPAIMISAMGFVATSLSLMIGMPAFAQAMALLRDGANFLAEAMDSLGDRNVATFMMGLGLGLGSLALSLKFISPLDMMKLSILSKAFKAISEAGSAINSLNALAESAPKFADIADSFDKMAKAIGSISKKEGLIKALANVGGNSGSGGLAASEEDNKKGHSSADDILSILQKFARSGFPIAGKYQGETIKPDNVGLSV